MEKRRKRRKKLLLVTRINRIKKELMFIREKTILTTKREKTVEVKRMITKK